MRSFLLLALLIYILPVSLPASEEIFRSKIEYLKKDGEKVLRFGHWEASHKMHQSPFDIVILEGRASFLEKHQDLIREFNKRGFNVWAFDFRGQGGSVKLINDSQKCHVDSYETYIADTKEFIDFVKAENHGRPIILYGSSMGGHIALRFGSLYADEIKGIILESPMIDIPTSPYPRWVAEALVNGGVKLGFSEKYAPGQKPFDPTKSKFQGNKTTRDEVRFLRQRQIAIDYPDYVRGGVTFGWVKATFDSIKILKDKDTLKHITVPVLFLQAGQDQIVITTDDKKVCSAIPSCQLINYADSQHHIAVERDEIRSQFLSDITSFIHGLEGEMSKVSMGMAH